MSICTHNRLKAKILAYSDFGSASYVHNINLYISNASLTSIMLQILGSDINHTIGSSAKLNKYFTVRTVV